MQAGHDHNIDILVTFDRSRRAGRASINPTPAQLAAEMKAMRKRWPWLHEFSTWNEVNIAKHPDTVAKWWLALTRACPSCTILGADLLDRSNSSDSTAAVTESLRAWLYGFLEATGGRQPAVWGLHNYIDANRGRTTVTRAVLKLVKGRIWFTETGGLVSRHNGSKFKIPAGAGACGRDDAVHPHEARHVSAPASTAATSTTGPRPARRGIRPSSIGHGQPRASLTYLRRFLGR